MSTKRIAVVTGGNKGIGYEIVKYLCKKYAGIVYLTARNEGRGLNACEKLILEGVKNPPKFHQLDIADDESIEKFRDYLKETHNGLDVLVNNAAIAYHPNSHVSFAEQAEKTMRINFTGTLNVCKALFPLLRPHARVVHVSSGSGRLGKITNESLKMELTRPDLTESELVDLMQQFLDATKVGDHESKGWPNSTQPYADYAVSKIGLNILTEIQARDNPYDEDKDTLINCCCPGSCLTDMAGPNATKMASEGAETPVYLVLIPPGSEQPHGKYYTELKEASWKYWKACN